MSQLSYARYGKDNVRLYKVDKDPKTGIHTVVEQTVRILLQGDIETSCANLLPPFFPPLTPHSYTKADNSVVVATDTQKQTTYILAKQHPIDPPEAFAAIIGDHFVNKYPHIHACHVKIIQHRWTRMSIDGKPHPHSFYRDSNEVRVVESVTKENEGVSIRSKIEKLLVLKSTGSAFHGFHRDEFTKLPETWDRILSTDIEAGWQWKTFKDAAEAGKTDFNGAWRTARDITMKIFAEDDSASVQATMYKMCDRILAAVPEIEAVDYALPNKHYFEIGKFDIFLRGGRSAANSLLRSLMAQGHQEPRQGRNCACSSV
jgi:urate oxidase